MTSDWTQELATAILVGIATLYLAKRLYLIAYPTPQGGGGCGSGGCGSCPSNANRPGKEEVQVFSIGPAPGAPGKNRLT